MGLVDKINSAPLNLASKIVKKTGKSKYSLAQACSFAAACPMIYATIDSYNNENPLYLLGGLFCFTQFMRTLYLGYRAKMDDPKALEYVVEKLGENGAARFNEHRKLLDAADSKASGAAFILTMNGLMIGALAFMESSSFQDLGGDMKGTLLYLSLFSPSMVLYGFSEYFQASK